MLELPRQRPTAETEGARTGRAHGLLRLLAARLLLALVLPQTVLSGGVIVLYPALAVEALGLDVSAVGVLAAASGLGGVVASLGLFALRAARRRRPGADRAGHGGAGASAAGGACPDPALTRSAPGQRPGGWPAWTS